MQEIIKKSFPKKWEQYEIAVLLGLLDGHIEKKYIDHFKNQVVINNILIYQAGHEYSGIFVEQNKIIIQAIINANKTILTS